jgi:hypothetical protein
MASTFNLLPDNNALLVFSSQQGEYVGISSLSYDWTASNATLFITSSEAVVNTRYVMQLAPSTSNDVVLTLNNIPLTLSDNGRAISANIKMKANSPISISSLLYIDSASASYDPNVQSINSGKYSAIHTNQASVPDDGNAHTATMKFTISGQGSANIYATLPHLIHELGFYKNRFVGRARTFLPDFYFEVDSSQLYPSFPFFRLLDILTSAAGETLDEHDRMYGVEQQQLQSPSQVAEYWASSSLVSTRSVRTDYIPWLSQFNGSLIKQNISKTDGTLFFDNPRIKRDFLEWQLSTSHYGAAAGSRNAILEAARQVLIKTKDGNPSTLSVAVLPRYLGDPFAIRVATLANETPDAEEGEVSSLVTQSVNWAKPMGYSITVQTFDEFFFSFDDPTLGALDNFRFG